MAGAVAGLEGEWDFEWAWDCWALDWEEVCEREEEVEWRGEVGDEEEGLDEEVEGLPIVRSLDMVDFPFVRRD